MVIAHMVLLRYVKDNGGVGVWADTHLILNDSRFKDVYFSHRKRLYGRIVVC